MRTGDLKKLGQSAYDNGGGGGGGKNTSTLVIGMVGNVTASQVDYLCDGVDDQVEIQQAISDANEGDTILILDGKYSIGATININKDNINIRGVNIGKNHDPLFYENEPTGTYLVNTEEFASSTSGIFTTQYSNIILENMCLRSTGTLKIFLLSLTTSVCIQNCTMQIYTDEWGYGIYTIGTKNVTIKNNLFEIYTSNENTSAIYANNANDILPENTRIIDNEFYNLRSDIFIGVINFFECINTHIEKNKCSNAGFRLSRLISASIDTNTFSETSIGTTYTIFILITSCNNMRFFDNRYTGYSEGEIYSGSKKIGFRLYGNNHTIIMSDNIFEYIYYGILKNDDIKNYLRSMEILKNRFMNCNGDISLSSNIEDVNIISNLCIYPGGSSIYLNNFCKRFNVSDNLIISSKISGTELSLSQISNSVINSNLIYTTSTASITISNSSNNLISNNMIYGKNYMDAGGGTNNTFVNNKYQ